MKRRKKIIFLGAVFVGMLTFTACTQPKEEKTVVHKEVEASKEPEPESELSATRKELEKLYEERGTKNYLTDTQIFMLEEYEIPLFDDLLQEYFFEDRMDEYLVRLEKLAKEKEEYDFLYNAISDHLIWDYQQYKEELSEEDCERFLEIINLCKKRLKTARIWEEPQEALEEETEESPTTIKLTDTRKKLETILEKRGFYNPRSEKEIEFLMDNYDIPCFELENSENSYLNKMEKLAKRRGEWDLLYENVSDDLIWHYDECRENLTEEQCQRILKLIKLCQKRIKTAKIY